MQHRSQRHARRSIRLPSYDYSRAGAYFVTLCIQGRECLLGEVVNDRVELSDMGHFVKEAWEGLAMQYSYVELDEYVVMPNHLHGVIVISSETPSVTERKSLGRVIGAFKTISTKQINSMRSISGQSIWQRSYYEHIIRNDGELNRVREYVMNNPMQWHLDTENPKASGGSVRAWGLATVGMVGGRAVRDTSKPRWSG